MNNKIIQNYESLAQSLNLRFDEHGIALYGQRGPYDVMIYPQNETYPYLLTVTISAQRSAGPLMKEECKQFKRENKPVGALAQNGSSIAMTLKNCTKQSKLQENLNNSLNALVNFLRAEGFRNCCQSCGQDDPIPCNISGVYMQLCPDCYSKLQHDSSMDFSQQQNKHENVIGGIVGALIGSLLGVAAIVIFSQLGYVAALSGVILAICTLKGYELLSGKLSKKGIVISVILMIVMTLFGDRLDWAILIANELKIDYMSAYRIFPALLQQNIIDMSAYVASLAMQYLFVLVGAIPTILNTLRNRKLQGRMYRLGGATQNFDCDHM